MAKTDEREHVTVASSPEDPTFEWPHPVVVDHLVIEGSLNECSIEEYVSRAAARASAHDHQIKFADGSADKDPTMLWGSDQDVNLSNVEGSESANRTDRAYANYKKLVGRTVDVFGDEIAASTWLSTANPDFGDKPPLQVAQEHGYDPEVLEPVLVRIEHGVYF